MASNFTLIKELGDKYKIRVRHDECGEAIIVGRCGQVYEHGPGRLGVMVMGKNGKLCASARRRLTAAGFGLHQNGDWEGSCLFQADNAEHMKLALGVIGACKSRKCQAGQFPQPQLLGPAPPTSWASRVPRFNRDQRVG